ncbi:hypothetical protein BDW74DRAFT_48132 [Aspergillus multicolor]|uniref:uncharacterized protein n=1 Tax=Aspergillus multicolor TaxID=41759 RepID=UPI003CCD4321
MMNYQKYYPAPSTYPPHTLSIPSHDPRFTASRPPAPPTPSVVVAIAAAAPAISSPSYSHRPLRPSSDQGHQPDQARYEMPRSAPSGAYNHPLSDRTPAVAPHSADTGYASFRRGDNVYHVSHATHGSRKRPHRDEGPEADPNLGSRYRGDGEGHTLYSGECVAS